MEYIGVNKCSNKFAPPAALRFKTYDKRIIKISGGRNTASHQACWLRLFSSLLTLPLTLRLLISDLKFTIW